MNENLYGNQILFYEYTNYQIIIESKEDYELMHIPAHPTVNPELFGHYSGIIRTVTYVTDTPCWGFNIVLEEDIICCSPDNWKCKIYVHNHQTIDFENYFFCRNCLH